MENTGSFVVTEHGGIDPQAESPRFFAKHFSAYRLAEKLAGGSALEIGFGDGYGAHYLAGRFAQVTAIDLFEKNVAQAAGKYPLPNLKFLQMQATDLHLPERSFDLVLSFQVIEHIPQALLPKYLEEIKRMLKTSGKACLSTLNLKKNRKPGQPYDKSPHHDKEFTPQEFMDFLRPFFRSVDLYGLYPTPQHAFYERLKKIGLCRGRVQRFYDGVTADDFVWKKKKKLDDCIDLLAVCHV